MTDWKNLSFGAPRRWGKAERKPVMNEDDGSRAGYHVEHWDDRVDAHAIIQPTRLKARRRNA